MYSCHGPSLVHGVCTGMKFSACCYRKEHSDFCVTYACRRCQLERPHAYDQVSNGLFGDGMNAYTYICIYIYIYI